MQTFEAKFEVNTNIAKTSAFHASTNALRKLTPPPIWVQFHHLDPLSEGAVAEFTMWFVVLPFRWKAVHSEVKPTGFIDQQVSGPLKIWKHEHQFKGLSENKTLVIDRIKYEHFSGLKGLIPRLFFNHWGLKFLFFYRKWITRLSLRM